jgi:uncharacterized protein (DUF2141 family)
MTPRASLARRLASLTTPLLLTPLLVAASLPTLSSAAEACTAVEVQNVRPAQGLLMVAVYADEAEFRRLPVMSISQRAGEQETMRFAVCGLEGREVAFSLFQDVNNNRKLDTNMVGMPSEPWGASGTLPGFSAPTWESSKVRLQGTPLTIALSR